MFRDHQGRVEDNRYYFLPYRCFGALGDHLSEVRAREG
jgi:hypothetical protein